MSGRSGGPDARTGTEPEPEAEWLLQRRCSLSPCQFGGCFLMLAAVSIVVALFFWAQGARFVAYFAGAEVLALGLAFALHALHAADGERLRIRGGQLLVERRAGLRQVQQALDLQALRVAETNDGAIELRARGQRLRVGAHADAARRRQVLLDLRRLVLRPVAA